MGHRGTITRQDNWKMRRETLGNEARDKRDERDDRDDRKLRETGRRHKEFETRDKT